MGGRGWFVGRSRRYLEPLLDAGRNAAAAAEALHKLLANYESLAEGRQEIKDLELKGDRIAQGVFEQASGARNGGNATIVRLTRSLDDVVDVIYAAVNRLYLYHVAKSTPQMKKFADIVRRQSTELSKALSELGPGGDRRRVAGHCVEVKRLENEADKLLNQVLADLFRGHDMATVIKHKDIYELLEAASDKCEDAANVLMDMAR